MKRWMKIRDIREALRSLFSMPVTSDFPKTRHRPADGFRGKPQFDEAGCVACGSCARVCPSGAILIHDPKSGAMGRKTRAVRRMEVRYDACHFCGLCEERCITGRGIRLTAEFDLALIDRTLATESIEKEMVFCEGCGRGVTTAVHLTWIGKRLGEMASANPALIRVQQDPRLTLQALPVASPPQRGDDAKNLCPDCRRKVRLAGG
jgi:formate hydrogenlyase subunit 6/NADH:ubiquinone oxidoreductase subunit I